MAAEDPGPAEYALLQSLFVNSKTHYPGNLHYVSKSLRRSTCISSPAELGDPTDLQLLVIPDPVFSSENDFQGAAADEALATFVAAYDEEEVFKLALESTFSDVRFLQAARKLELPSLKSDSRHDLKALARTIAEAKCHDFFCKPSSLPLEPVDERKDEGLGTPACVMHFHDQLTRGAEPDELDFSVEDLLFVSESLYDEWTDKDLKNVFEQEIGCTVGRVRTMTPPLIAPPLDDSDENELFVPNTDTCEIDNLSEPESLLNEDLERVRKTLSAVYDGPRLPDASTSENIDVPSDTPSLEVFTPKHQNAGMEVPILPRSDDTMSNSQEEQCFRALIGSVPGFNLKSPRGGQTETAVDEDESSFNEQFSLLIKDKADGMTRRLEQEQVEAVDAVARMQPPLLDFSTPPPDWQGQCKTRPPCSCG
ncbi:nucleoporin NUP49 [Colletotrichum tofieldiae]|nr:nucleoporin NUP49 [Colletotrichum tofieldiae]